MIAARCKSAVASRAVRSSRSCVVRVSCQKGGLEQVQIAAASVLAATIIASPANAGVVLQQPELKKLFQDDGAAAPAPVKKEYKFTGLSAPAAPAAAEKPAAAPKPKKQEVSEQGGDVDPRSAAIPGFVVVAGAAFAASKIDGGFDEFMDRSLLKDSNILGAGFEPALKTEGGPAIGAAKKGTTKVSKGTQKKGKK